MRGVRHPAPMVTLLLLHSTWQAGVPYAVLRRETAAGRRAKAARWMDESRH
jgi:hypothetical protein